jgi:hypothetical protein
MPSQETTALALTPVTPYEIVLAMNEPRFPAVVDSTMMACADSCPQRFFLEYILKLAPSGISVDLHAGGAIAVALETARREFYMFGRTQEEALETALMDFFAFWGVYQAPAKHAKDFINCWAAVESYFQEYPMATDYIRPYMKVDGSPAVEFTFSIPTGVIHPVTQEPIIYGGRFDMLGVRSDGLVVVDEKTTKAIQTSWLTQWGMRGQFIGYVFGAQVNGFDCHNALVRGIAIQKTQFKHVEVPLQISKWQIDRWWKITQQKLQKIVNFYVTSQNLAFAMKHEHRPPEEILDAVHNVWDFSFADGCSSYGGCSFLGICQQPRPWQWYTDYENRCWNPLLKNPSEGSSDKHAGMAPVHISQFT